MCIFFTFQLHKQTDFNKSSSLQQWIPCLKDGRRHGLPGWRIVSEVGAVDGVDLTEVLHVAHVEMNQEHVLHQQAFLLQLSCQHTHTGQLNKELLVSH